MPGCPELKALGERRSLKAGTDRIDVFDLILCIAQPVVSLGIVSVSGLVRYIESSFAFSVT